MIYGLNILLFEGESDKKALPKKLYRRQMTQSTDMNKSTSSLVVIDGFGGAAMKRSYPDPAFEKSFIRTCLSTMWLKQSLKLIVLVACMTAVIFQLSECIMKLCYPPVSTRTELKINSTVSYPALTFCRNPPYRSSVLQKYGLGNDIRYTSEWANFPFNETSLTQFWHEATFTLNESIVQAGLYKQETNVQLESAFHFENGRCHTLLPLTVTKEAGSLAGYSVTLKHHTSASQQGPWNIYVHQVTDMWTENKLQSAGTHELVVLPVGEVTNIKVTVQQLERVNHPNSPCNSDRSYSANNCEEHCRWREVSEFAGCSVPWMPISNLPECNNYTSMRTMIVEYLKYSVSTACSLKCAKSCHTTQFSAFIVNRGSVQAIYLSRHFSQIYLFHASKMITAVREQWDYDLSRFVADAGGSLGFLLGVSVLSLLSMLGKVLQIFTCCAKARSNNSTDGHSNSSNRSSINSIANQKY